MLHHTPVRHTIASASTAILETVLFIALVKLTPVSPNILNPFTIFLGTGANYLLNKHWVFGSSQRAWHREVSHFFIVAGLALLAQSLFFSLIYNLIQMPIAAKLIALAIGFTVNYPLKRRVFHQG